MSYNPPHYSSPYGAPPPGFGPGGPSPARGSPAAGYAPPHSPPPGHAGISPPRRPIDAAVPAAPTYDRRAAASQNHALKVQEVEKMRLRTEQLRRETATLRRTLASCASPEQARAPAPLQPPATAYSPAAAAGTPTGYPHAHSPASPLAHSVGSAGGFRGAASPVATSPVGPRGSDTVAKLTEVVADLRRRLDQSREDARDQLRKSEERIHSLELDLELARIRSPKQSAELYNATQTIKAQGDTLEQLRALCLTQQEKITALTKERGPAATSPAQTADLERRLRDVGDEHAALQSRTGMLESENTLLNVQIRDLQKELALYRALRDDTGAAAAAVAAGDVGVRRPLSPPLNLVPVSNPVYSDAAPNGAGAALQHTVPPPSHQALQRLQHTAAPAAATATPARSTAPPSAQEQPLETTPAAAPRDAKGYPAPPASIKDDVRAAVATQDAAAPASSTASRQPSTPSGLPLAKTASSKRALHLRLPAPLHDSVRDSADINTMEVVTSEGIRLLQVASPRSKMKGIAMLEASGSAFQEDTLDGVEVLTVTQKEGSKALVQGQGIPLSKMPSSKRALHLRLPAPLHDEVRDSSDINASEVFTSEGIRLLQVASPRSKMKGIAMLEASGSAFQEDTLDGVDVLTVTKQDSARSTPSGLPLAKTASSKRALHLRLPAPLHDSVRDSADINTTEVVTSEGIRLLQVASPRSKMKGIAMLEASGSAFQEETHDGVDVLAADAPVDPAPPVPRTPEQQAASPSLHLHLPSPLHCAVRDAGDINATEVHTADGLRLLRVASPGSKMRGLALLEECGHTLRQERVGGLDVMTATADDHSRTHSTGAGGDGVGARTTRGSGTADDLQRQYREALEQRDQAERLCAALWAELRAAPAEAAPAGAPQATPPEVALVRAQRDQAEALCEQEFARAEQESAALRKQVRALEDERDQLLLAQQTAPLSPLDQSMQSLPPEYRGLDGYAAFAETVTSLSTLGFKATPDGGVRLDATHDQFDELIEQLRTALAQAELQRDQAETVCIAQVEEAEEEIDHLRGKLEIERNARRKSESRVKVYAETLKDHNVQVPTEVPEGADENYEDHDALTGFTAFADPCEESVSNMERHPTTGTVRKTSGGVLQQELADVRAERDAAVKEVSALKESLALAESQRDQAEEFCMAQEEDAQAQIAKLTSALQKAAAPQPLADVDAAAEGGGDLQYEELTGFVAFGAGENTLSSAVMAELLESTAAHISKGAPSVKSAEREEALDMLKSELEKHK